MSDVPDKPIATIEYRSTRETRSVPVYAEEYVTFLLEQIESLRAENERLRQDAERYRWLSSQPGSYPALARFVVSAAGTVKHGFATPLDVYKAVDLDAAIDAAMKREGER